MPSFRQIFLHPHLPPVIIKLTDGKENFRQMKIAERDIVNSDIMQSLDGPPRDSEIPRGGDLFVHPMDTKQQEILLSLTSIAGRPVSCSLPRSSTTYKGIIRGVPTTDSVDDIKSALADQSVTDAFRPKNRDAEESDRIILTFSSRIPPRVKIASMSYEVQQYYPNPYRCRRCWRLGHTQTFCQSKAQGCKKCGLAHEEKDACQTKCINCGNQDHECDSISCPAYVEAKNILKLATVENISIKEARLKSQSLYSTITRAPIAHRPTTKQLVSQDSIARESPELALMKAQVTQLQAEMREMKEQTIPTIVKDIRLVAAHAKDSTDKLNARFDRIDNFMERMLSSPIFQQQPVMVRSEMSPLKNSGNMMMVDPRSLSSPPHHSSSTEQPHQWIDDMSHDGDQ